MIEDIKKGFEANPQIKILFLFEVNEERLDDLKSMDLGDIHHLHILNNFIASIVAIEGSLKKKKILLTFPLAKPEGKDWLRFPFSGLYYANKELRLDEVGRFMDQYDLKPYQQSLVKQYQKELLTKKNQERLIGILRPDRFDEKSIKRGLISSILDFSSVVNEELILAKILSYSNDESKLKSILNRVQSLELTESLVGYFNEYLDDQMKDLSLEALENCGNRAKYNLITKFITRPIVEDSYRTLKYQDTMQRNRFLGVIQAWKDHATLGKQFHEKIRTLGPHISSSKIVEWYGFDHDYGFYSDELLTSLTQQLIEDLSTKPSQTVKRVASLLQIDLEEKWMSIYRCMHGAANMFVQLSQYPHFDYNRLEDYIYEYQNEWYKIDFNYREFIVNYQKLVQDETAILLEGLYKQVSSEYDKYLKGLNISWQKLLVEKQSTYNEIKGTSHQFAFYDEYVKPNTSKQAIIISDAFRYEIGRELNDLLQQDSKNKVQIDIGLASIPSVTMVGMANLLPGKEMEFSDKMEVLLDNAKTQSTANRKDILNKANSKAHAISFKEISKLTKEEGRQLFMDYSPVYIYHNMIDNEGDKQLSEDRAFDASERTIQEIQLLIKKIYNWNVYHVLVTADHGFIYTHDSLTDATLETAPKSNHVIKAGSRYMIVDSKFSESYEGYRLSLKNTSKFTNDYDVLLPRAVNRFKKAGSGNHYIHGGGSLQELLIPVIKYYRKKEGVSEQVKIKLLTKNLNTFGSLKLNILQVEPITEEIKPLKTTLGFYNDSNELVSNLEELTFDSASDNPTDRTKQAILSLNSTGSQLSQCQLKIFEIGDTNRLNPLIEKTVIINTIMEKDEF